MDLSRQRAETPSPIHPTRIASRRRCSWAIIETEPTGSAAASPPATGSRSPTSSGQDARVSRFSPIRLLLRSSFSSLVSRTRSSATSAFTRVFDALWRCSAEPGPRRRHGRMRRHGPRLCSAPYRTMLRIAGDAALRPGHETEVNARSSLRAVIARSSCDEAIQSPAAEAVWIASLRSQ